CGQSWWSYEHGIPYPATESSMEALRKEIPDPANRYELELYWLDHWDAHRIRLLIDEAAAWGKSNNVPLICNEFGALREVPQDASRTHWNHDVKRQIEEDAKR